MKNFLAALLLGLALPIAAGASEAGNCDDPHPMRLALTPIKNPAAQLAQYRPLIHQLEEVLGRRIEIVPTPSYGTVIEGLLSDSIDLAELGPASYALALDRGARISAFATFSRPRGAGGEAASSYRSLLIVRRDRGFDSLVRLRGTSLALTDPASTSGALLPRQMIRQLTGQPLESYFRRVTFSGTHDRAIDSLHRGQVDAAFVSSTQFDEALRQGRLRPDEIQVLWESAQIPHDPFVLRDRLCPALAAQVREVFLGNPAPLDKLFRELAVSGFVPTSDEPYRALRALFAEPPSRPERGKGR